MKTSQQEPLFSIIVPVYNTEQYLNQCVDSILNQSFKDYELWLIDDGSKDRSISIIKEYEAKDSRVKTAFIQGTGPSMPRNYGLKHAKGQFIIFIDSDDYLRPGALRLFADVVKENPDVDFIKGNQLILMEKGREAKSVFKSWRQPFNNTVMNGADLMTKVLKTDFTPTNSVFRKSILLDSNLYFKEEIIILEDIPFIMELCSYTKKAIYLDTETYVYRLFSETSLARSKRNLPKVMSLAMIADCEKNLADKFDGEAKNLALTRSVEHCVSSLFQGCTELTSSESKKILAAVKRVYPKLPHLGRSKGHKACIIMYNISPFVTHFIMRITAPLTRNKIYK